jgi:hypothetical protein
LNDRQRPSDSQMHPLHAAVHAKMLSTGQYAAGPVFAMSEYKNLLVFVRKDACAESRQGKFP